MSIANESDILEIIRDAHVDEEALACLDPQKTFSEAGLDSLDMANVLFKIEDKYGIQIPDDDALALVNVMKIVEFINDGHRAGQGS